MDSCSYHLSIEDVPEFLRFNKYIKRGYRGDNTIKGCLKSLFFVHNESGNIWSHLLGIIVLSYTLLCRTYFHSAPTWLDRNYQFLYPPENDAAETLYSCYLLACVILMLLGSVIYHLFMPMCKTVTEYRSLLNLDQITVVLGMYGTAHSFIIYGSPQPSYFNYCCFALLTLSLFKTIHTCFSFASPIERIKGIGYFVLLRMFLGALVFFYGGSSPSRYQLLGFTDALQFHTWSFVLLLCGAVFNATRFPERVAPGKFDLSLHSHSCWHFLTLFASIFCHFGNLSDITDYKLMQRMI